MGSAVCTPWPISLRGIASTTLPSAAILIQPLSATSPVLGQHQPASPGASARGSTPQPTTSAPAAPAALSSQVRRFMNGFRLSNATATAGLHSPAARLLARRIALVGAAAADIGHGLVDVGIGGCGFFSSSAAAAISMPLWQ